MVEPLLNSNASLSGALMVKTDDSTFTQISSNLQLQTLTLSRQHANEVET
jgi:hypothetical protein